MQLVAWISCLAHPNNFYISLPTAHTVHQAQAYLFPFLAHALGKLCASLDLELVKQLRIARVASDRLEGAEAPDTVGSSMSVASTTQCSSIFLQSWLI
jgi:hypothetical protein